MTAKSVCMATAISALTFLPLAASAEETAVEKPTTQLHGLGVEVNVDNFVVAETARQFDGLLKMSGGINKLISIREPTPLDKQPVIRMNRDTLYTFAVVDISKGAKLTLPENDGRYNSAAIVNEKEYVNKVFYEPGVYDLTRAEFDTDYVAVIFRTLVDSSDPADIRKANELQNEFRLEAASANTYTHPDYDEKSLDELRDLLLKMSKFMPDFAGAFGTQETTKDLPHLLGAAFGWGGLPSKDAFYKSVEPDLPVGRYQIDVPKDVPIKAFWSVSVYNKEGYFQKNALGVYNINSQSGKANPDGSMTVNLGGCDDASRINCIPLTDGWNYVVRMYRPDPSVIDGKWTFPAAHESN